MLTIKTKEEIEILREGGKILSKVLDEVSKIVKPGVTTGELEVLACRLIEEAGGRPAFKDLDMFPDKFPTALCTSINDEIVHAPALPSRELKEGDIVGIDIGMEYPLQKSKTKGIPYNKYSKLGGYYTDMAATLAVGEVSKETRDLLDTTKKSLELGIAQVRPGARISDIGRAIQSYAESRGFSVVRDLIGHGVGHDVHEDPQVPNYEVLDNSVMDRKLKVGMVIAIEPMLNTGTYSIVTGADGYTFSTEDGGLSAQFEHTIAVTKNGHKIITAL